VGASVPLRKTGTTSESTTIQLPWRSPLTSRPPDIVLLSAGWPSRALLRAQLIEQGFEVVTTDDWSSTRRHLRPGIRPALVIADLKALPNPDEVLEALRALMRPERVLVLVAAGTVLPAVVRDMGFQTLARPFAISEIVARAERMVHAAMS
jgi:DNA-binding response OmpR family regulator